MKLRLTLECENAGQGAVDIELEAPDDMRTGEVARQLAQMSPYHSKPCGAFQTIRGGARTGVSPDLSLAASGIKSGMFVALVDRFNGPDRTSSAWQPAARATILAGPDAGQAFDLPMGPSYVGRGSSCEVRLTDSLVSRRHARIEVGQQIEVVDLGSANGVQVSGESIERTVLPSATSVQVGDSTIAFDLLTGSDGADTSSFVRSPTVEQLYGGREFVLTGFPSPPQKRRLPIIASLAPLALGLMLFLATGRLESLLFVLLSPVMLIGGEIEERVFGKRDFKKASDEFRDKASAFLVQGKSLLGEESTRRKLEHLPLADRVESLVYRRPPLWERRSDQELFLKLALGLGSQPTRNVFKVEGAESTSSELQVLASETVAQLQTVEDVPVVADLRTEGVIGICSTGGEFRELGYKYVLDLVLSYSPAELSLALFASDLSAPKWDWLKWLPHVIDTYSELSAPLSSGASAAAELANELYERLAEESVRGHVLVVVEDDSPLQRSVLIELLEMGPPKGVFVVWIAQSRASLPAGCSVIVEVESNASSTVSYRLKRAVYGQVAISPVSFDYADSVARSLSPVRDVSAPTRNSVGVPDSVSGPTVLNISAEPDCQAFVERWAQTASDRKGQEKRSLRAAVGAGAGQPFVIDLRKQGPHALVGGTTGAGKSEFLQSWVLGLASSYSPSQVTFLFVDYKGGAAFSECTKLPHCVGLVTDLSPHLVDRSLTSLNAELHYRELLFNELEVKDLEELEKRGDGTAPPALIIVVDEFAALSQEVPDFVDGVVNVAQRGRSLGLHLILATQRPAGVITGNLRANTNLRVALRMADESDSSDVIDSDDAAHIDVSLPGRGYVKTGPGRTSLFQTAYYGGNSAGSDQFRPIRVSSLGAGQASQWKSIAAPRQADRKASTDLERLVEQIGRAAEQLALSPPRKPWLPELPELIDLFDLVGMDGDGVPLGKIDIPKTQSQPTLSFRPEQDGNLLILGASGSGKSAALRTLALSLGIDANSIGALKGACHIYCLDFGSHSLHPLSVLPHVGAVLSPTHESQTTRLLREVRDLIDDRRAVFQSAEADTLASYRRISGKYDEPRIVLMIDNFGAFAEMYDTRGKDVWFDCLRSIMADGRPVGVNVVLSATRTAEVPTAFLSYIQRKLVLRLSSENDYASADVPTNVLSVESPAGSGLEGTHSLQFAVPGGSGDLAVQVESISSLADSGTLGRWAAAPPVPQLPVRVTLDDYPAAEFEHNQVVVGTGDLELRPVGVKGTGTFLIVGPPGSGKTSTLLAIAKSFDRANPDAKMVLFATRRSEIDEHSHWDVVASTAEAQVALAEELARQLREVSDDFPIGLFIENISEVMDEFELDELLPALCAEVQNKNGFVVAEGESGSVSAYKHDFMLRSRRGLLLQPENDEGDLFSVALSHVAELPPGRGFLVENKRVELIQAAVVGGKLE